VIGVAAQAEVVAEMAGQESKNNMAFDVP